MSAGYLFITEYTNLGDVGVQAPVEPAHRVQRIAVGETSAPLHADTRIVVLRCTYPCRVWFSSQDEQGWPLGSGWPLSDDEEVHRLVRPNTRMVVRAFPEKAS